jgi:hypothetical protein
MTKRGDQVHAVLDPDPDGLLRAFANQTVLFTPPPHAMELRGRVVHAMERERARVLEARARRTRLGHLLVLGAAAAALPLAILWGVSARRAPTVASAVVGVVPLAGSAAVLRGGVERPLATAGQAWLGAEEELRTGPDSSARASLPTGTVVDVGPSARLRFDPAGGLGRGPMRDHVELVAGKVDVRVPKLADGDEVDVHTAGASVVVHGTEFSVERTTPQNPGDPGVTRVAVTQGTVTVFTGDEERVLTARGVLVLVTPTEANHSASASSSVTPPKPAVLPADSSSSATKQPGTGTSTTLAAENAALAEAMQWRRDHDSQRALSRLGEFLERYPRSPLAETARVERLRVLEDMGATVQLRREAQRYLADYPKGFARQEATRILTVSPSP